MQCFFCGVYCVTEGAIKGVMMCTDCCGELEAPVRMGTLPTFPNICAGSYFYDYNSVVQQIMHAVKFKGNRNLGALLRDRVTCCPSLFLASDVVVSVPSHWARQLVRGKPHVPFLFSNMGLSQNTPCGVSFSKKDSHLHSVNSGIFSPKALPEAFCDSPNILDGVTNYCPNYLVRSRWARSSHGLSRSQRREAHTAQRFCWRGPPGVQSVTILDDICTTGATVCEIARLLKSKGIGTVKVLVIAYVTYNT